MLYRLFGVFRRRRLEAELDAELRYHVDRLEAEHRARGLSAEQARAAAARDMGGMMRTKEAHRDQAGVPIVETLVRDIRYGWRTLRRTPVVTAAVVMTLAIGIGANTAMFAVVHGVLLKPLPYPASEALVTITHRMPGRDVGTEIPSAPYLHFTYREDNRTLEHVGLWRTGTATITGLNRPEQVDALVVTHEILGILGIRPAIGRTFSSDEDSPGGALTAVLTHGYWQRRFGGDRSVVGRQLTVDGGSREVIGVMSPEFRFLDRNVDIVYPFQLRRSDVTLGRYVFQGLGRLRPGVTLEEARADLARLVPVAVERFPPPAGYVREQFARRPVAPHLRPLKEAVVGQIGNMLWVLMGALGLVLLISAANVANLLLVRVDGRQQELAIRAALGAGWARIASTLFIESILLGVLGGAAAWMVASGAIAILPTVGLTNLPRMDEISLDPIVLLFTTLMSIGVGVCIGLLPVVKYAKPHLTATLGGGSRTMSDSRERRRARGALVVAQIAIAMILLVCSGLMIRTFQALSHVDPGFAGPEQVQMVHLDASGPDAERTARLQHAIVDRIAAIPDVKAVAFADISPLADNTGNDTVLIVDGRTYAEGEPKPLRRFAFISPRFFETLGTPLLAGRDLTWTDLHDRRMVAVVSATFARQEWGVPEQALHKRVRASPADPWREIVGVVGDLHDNGMSQPPPALVYFPAVMDRFWGAPTVSFGSSTFVIRSGRAGSDTFVREIEQAVWQISGDLPVAQIRTLGEVYRRSLSRTSFTLAMLAIAGAMGLALGFIGLYGVIAYSVALRTREIGIRLALGAQAHTLQRVFMRDGVTLAAVGIFVGLSSAAGVTRLMSALLFGVAPVDPLTYAAVASGVFLMAMLATYLPARRATRGSPIDALRQA
jgi:putative ABC transport system permease protein